MSTEPDAKNQKNSGNMFPNPMLGGCNSLGVKEISKINWNLLEKNNSTWKYKAGVLYPDV